MAEFLTTKKTVSMIEEIICSAQSSLVLISPYWQLSDNLFERISDSAKRNVAVTIVFGKSYKPENLGKLPSLKNVSVKYLDNLHAKCYYNQDSMIISSMNMYEFSENNREMSIYIKRDTDMQLFESAKKEAEHFLQHSLTQSFKKQEYSIKHDAAKPPSIGMYVKKEGACIRCSNSIKYDPLKPLCNSCYNSWAKWQDDEYPENFCHSCGHEADTNVAYPECRSCYKSNSKKIAG